MTAASKVERAIQGAAIIGNVKPTKSCLARLMGVNRSQVTRWVAGVFKPSEYHDAILKRLALLYDQVEQCKENAAIDVESLRRGDQ